MYTSSSIDLSPHTQGEREREANGSQNVRQSSSRPEKEGEIFFFLLSLPRKLSRSLKKSRKWQQPAKRDEEKKERETDIDRERHRRRYANKMFPLRVYGPLTLSSKMQVVGIRERKKKRDFGNLFSLWPFPPFLFQIIKDECRSIQLSRVPQWSRSTTRLFFSSLLFLCGS